MSIVDTWRKFINWFDSFMYELHSYRPITFTGVDIPRTIIITIESKHYWAATDFTNPKGCPLYHALKEMFPQRDISVSNDNVNIIFKDYDNHELFIIKYNFNVNAWGSAVMPVEEIERRIVEKKTYKPIKLQLSIALAEIAH